MLYRSAQAQGRGSQGAVGATCPRNLGAVEAPSPQFWTVNVVHFYFCLFLHVNLGLSQKIVEQIRGVFSFGKGLPWTPGDVCPQLQSSSRAPAQAIDILLPRWQYRVGQRNPEKNV